MNTLTNIDILEICKKQKLVLSGIFMKDNLPNKFKKGYYIINLQSSDEGNGTHWTALYYSDNEKIYFDAFGFPAPEEVEDKINKYMFNHKQIQNINTSSCGFYCIAFIKFLNNFKEKDRAFKTFIDLFSTNTARNEEILQSILN